MLFFNMIPYTLVLMVPMETLNKKGWDQLVSFQTILISDAAFIKAESL